MNTFNLPTMAVIFCCIFISISSGKAGVVDYWRLEEGSGTNVADQTGFANGTIQGIMVIPDSYFWSTNVPDPIVPQTGQPDLYSIVLGTVGASDVYLAATPSSTVTLTNFTVEMFFTSKIHVPYTPTSRLFKFTTNVLVCLVQCLHFDTPLTYLNPFAPLASAPLQN